jgi:tetrahydromethanopterin S-methyltransferase subunit F|tara:strand:+ start:1427 stop:1900 length:474 start_codon:yes stop_codon:yes gene_type:complete
MDPISTGLAGIALVQKSVELIKSNINTVNDIRDIAGALDGLFEGEKQVQKKRFSDKSIVGQSKDAAHSVIDAKLAQEQLEEISIMIDNRFGYGTWRAIIAERAKRIAEEKEAIKQAKIEAERKRKKRNEEIKFAMFVTSIIGAVTGLLVLVVLIVFS